MQCDPGQVGGEEGWADVSLLLCSVKEVSTKPSGSSGAKTSHQRSPWSPGNIPESVLLAPSITGGEQSPREAWLWHSMLLDCPARAQSPWSIMVPITGDLWGWTHDHHRVRLDFWLLTNLTTPGPVQTLLEDCSRTPNWSSCCWSLSP